MMNQHAEKVSSTPAQTSDSQAKQPKRFSVKKEKTEKDPQEASDNRLVMSVLALETLVGVGLCIFS